MGDVIVMEPRGIRNNNPGNIRLNPKNRWVGQLLGGTDKDFCQFETMAAGVRALAIILLNYQLGDGLMTVDAIIGRWAPSSENNTDAYVDACCEDIGAQPAEQINLKDENELLAMVNAIARHENGKDAWNAIPLLQVATGVAQALKYKGC